MPLQIETCSLNSQNLIDKLPLITPRFDWLLLDKQIISCVRTCSAGLTSSIPLHYGRKTKDTAFLEWILLKTTVALPSIRGVRGLQKLKFSIWVAQKHCANIPARFMRPFLSSHRTLPMDTDTPPNPASTPQVCASVCDMVRRQWDTDRLPLHILSCFNL